MRIDGWSQDGEGGIDERQDSDRVRCSTREDSPDGPGRMWVRQRRRSRVEASSTCANRCFRLRGDHRLETKEQALRLILSSTWSMMRSISSCGNPDMMVVGAQQAAFYTSLCF